MPEHRADESDPPHSGVGDAQLPRADARVAARARAALPPAADARPAQTPAADARARAGRRRVTTSPPAGSDPFPLPEAPRHRADENDAQLKADKPPHWG